MRRACKVCLTEVEITIQQRKMIDKDGPFFCSPGCLIKEIDNHPIIDDSIPLTDFFKDHMLRMDERLAPGPVWSVLLRQFFRSAAEVETAVWLKWVALESFVYETLIFPLSIGENYVPDFYLFKHCLIEVKGVWESGSRRKVNIFREDYPNIPLYVIDSRLTAQIKKENRCVASRLAQGRK